MAKLKKQHMTIHWHDMVKDDDSIPACDADLKEKATLVGRFGLMLLAAGSGAWRVRNLMNKISRSLNISCSADIGLVSIECTCIDKDETYTQSLSIPTTGVNTDKISELGLFAKEFPDVADKYSVNQFLDILDQIQEKKAYYNAWIVGFAAAMACGAFTFLLGGGIIEMICAFFGAGAGNFTRKKMLEKKISLIGNVGVSVAVSCAVYVIAVLLLQKLFGASEVHQAGYICAMLFVIPGFPLITGGIDLAKLDMRSGLERISYAVLIITMATLTGGATAMLFKFQPADFQELRLGTQTEIIFRIIASFFGVYNFSLMFNSPKKMAFTAGLIGMITNTLRLELIDLASFPVGVAAFIGAFATGCIASVAKKKIGFPRITLTVPAIVIMVPGLYMYRGIYHLSLSDTSNAAIWLTKAFIIVIALPLGLVVARLLTDTDFRHCT